MFEAVMNYTWFCWAPMMTRVGDTLVYDTEEITNMDKVISKFAPQFKNSIVGIGGHNDGTFNLPKPDCVYPHLGVIKKILKKHSLVGK